jgi:hypothetical protein
VLHIMAMASRLIAAAHGLFLETTTHSCRVTFLERQDTSISIAAHSRAWRATLLNRRIHGPMNAVQEPRR